jgi:Arc/MetJ family transcription regulator
MRTTLDINEQLYQEAVKATGINKKTTLVHMGLQELVRKAAAERLSKLYGAFKGIKLPPRRKYAS